MGQMMTDYIASTMPHLLSIVEEEEEELTPTLPPGQEGIVQPEGATTFPQGPEPEPMQGQPIGPGGQALAPMATMAGPGAAAGAPPTATAAPEPSLPGPQVQDQQDRSGEFEKGPDSFMGMADAHAKDQDPKDIDNAMKSMEEGGVDIDAQHAELTGTPEYEGEDDPEGKQQGKGDPKKLTRQEKALILMEFGLNLMASSGTGEGTWASDIGQAGAAAMKGHMGRGVAREERLAKAEERKQKSRLTEAQIAKAEKPKTSVKSVGGKLMVINEDTNQAEPVLWNGEPVDADNVDKYASEVDRQAYEDVVCSAMEGKELSKCKRRALAYSKGGAAKVAFPELEIADQRENVMDILQDPDNRSAKYPVASAGGEQIRWRDMTEGQKMEVRDALVEQRTKQPNVTTKDRGPKKDTTGILAQLSPEDRARLKPGKVYGLADGRKFKIVDGVPQIVE